MEPQVWVRFFWSATKAERVELACSHDNWTSRKEMKKLSTCFGVELLLPVGNYTYKFIVDGEWCYDIRNKTETDSDGNVNNLIYVFKDMHDDEIGSLSDGEEEPTRFVWNDSTAESVYVMGTFDNWTDVYEMPWDEKKERFSVNLMLKPRAYFYKFIVDGNWCIDMTIEHEADFSGNVNNKVMVVSWEPGPTTRFIPLNELQ